MKIECLALVLCFSLTACVQSTQTTSGASWLEKYKDVPTVAVANADGTSIEEQLRVVAAVEPVLRFPARIGLARIDHGQLSAVPAEEAEAWLRTRDSLGEDFGEFLPLSPVVAEMTAASVGYRDRAGADNVMNRIRLGAARQHLDAILVYEVYSNADSVENLLSIADLTIIGAFVLPSRLVSAEGFANAMLIDVLQGYPYGTMEVVLEKESGLSTTWSQYGRRREMAEAVKIRAGVKLAEEAKDMFRDVRLALAEQRAAQ